MTSNKAILVDSASFPGAYDMTITRAIIDHPTHGRLILSQGFGGMDSVHGGAYRWRHGRALKALPGTTIDDIKPSGEEVFRDMEWSGHAVAKLAESLGL